MDLPPISTGADQVSAKHPPRADREAAMWSAAQDLEVSFLSEMLKATGLGEVSDSFGGGAGEEHFSSFLRDEQARAMVATGGIGLAKSLYHSLKDREHD